MKIGSMGFYGHNISRIGLPITWGTSFLRVGRNEGRCLAISARNVHPEGHFGALTLGARPVGFVRSEAVRSAFVPTKVRQDQRQERGEFGQSRRGAMRRPV